VAEEVRHAVDAYLAGVSAEELEILDAATLEAKRHLDAMAADLDRLNAKLDATFAELERLRAGSPVAAGRAA
jgi:ferritin-like protein